MLTARIGYVFQAKKECLPNEKPATIKTHLRNMIVVPEMIGSVVGIYNGKVRMSPQSQERISSINELCGTTDLQHRRDQARDDWSLPC